jgi:hypothetical protein
MDVAAFFAFLIGAAFGIFMAVMHWRGKKSGMALGIVHGLWTISGVVLLAVGLAMVDATVGWWILAAFLLTAAGGAYLFSRQVRDEPWPNLAIIAHGGLAIVSIVLLGWWLLAAEPLSDEGLDGGAPAQTTENETIPTEELTE